MSINDSTAVLRPSAYLPRWEIQQDQAGDGDGNTEAGEKSDRFSGKQSPEETPEGKQVGNCSHMGGGDLGEQAVVEQVGEAASSEAEHSNGDGRAHDLASRSCRRASFLFALGSDRC
jgi:hypothetical protein